MPQKWWNALGLFLMSVGVSFQDRERQRHVFFAFMLARLFATDCPDEYAAIVSGKACPVPQNIKPGASRRY